jgi:hypothetical protein
MFKRTRKKRSRKGNRKRRGRRYAGKMGRIKNGGPARVNNVNKMQKTKWMKMRRRRKK